MLLHQYVFGRIILVSLWLAACPTPIVNQPPNLLRVLYGKGCLNACPVL